MGKNNAFCLRAVLGLGLIAKKTFYHYIMMSWQNVFCKEDSQCVCSIQGCITEENAKRIFGMMMILLMGK